MRIANQLEKGFYSHQSSPGQRFITEEKHTAFPIISDESHVSVKRRVSSGLDGYPHEASLWTLLSLCYTILREEEADKADEREYDRAEHIEGGDTWREILSASLLVLNLRPILRKRNFGFITNQI